jgi:hypothetical protein
MYASVSGGAWSSSATAVATVDATSGVVTGISTGFAFISYTVTGACGTSTLVDSIYVNPTTTAGSIYGGSSVEVGTSTTLWVSGASVSGTWYSADPSIATVSSSGVVTGAAIGTTTIEYVVSGCTGYDTASYSVTVTTLNGISGNVIFDTSYWGNVKVWLITFNTSTMDLEAVDSVTLYCSGTSVGYSFTGLATDSFRVKAALDSSMSSSSFIPTYHDSSYHWNTAAVIYHVSGTSDINENIHMRTGVATSGPGFISGNVMSGADKGTSGSTPVEGMLIYVVNSVTGAQLQNTYTDASGNYSFINLPVGATYYIYPEAINYATTVYSSITLTTSTPGMTAANFKQHTVSKTITPIPAGLHDVQQGSTLMNVYPNPTSGMLNMTWTVKADEKAVVMVSDMTGRELATRNLNLAAGTGTSQLDLSNLAEGLYNVGVRSASLNYHTTVQVSK